MIPLSASGACLAPGLRFCAAYLIAAILPDLRLRVKMFIVNFCVSIVKRFAKIRPCPSPVSGHLIHENLSAGTPCKRAEESRPR